MRRAAEFLLSRKERYWHLRQKSAMVRFRLQKFIYEIRTSFSELLKTLSHILGFSRGSIFPIFYVVLALGGVLLIDSVFFLNGSSVNISESTYDTFLGTIAGIAGVVIGLYYAAISGLGTSIYSRFPADVRDLVAREPVSMSYIKYLAFTTFYCVGLLWLRFIGYGPSLPGGVVALVLSGIGLFTIVQLGQRVLHFGDPTTLTYHLFDVFLERSKSASVNGYRWHDPSFQNYYGDQAKSLLQSLRTINNIVKKEDFLSTHPYLELARRTFESMWRYSFLRKRIPSDSRWYPNIYTHQSWYEVSDTNAQFAGATGHLNPQEVRNINWVEVSLSEILKDCFDKNLKLETLDLALDASQVSVKTISILTRNLEGGLAKNLYLDLASSLNLFLKQNGKKAIGDEQRLSLIAIVASIHSIPSYMIVELYSYLEKFSSSEIDSFVQSVNWKDKRSFYCHELPYKILPRVEQIKKWIDFENAAENRRVSPDWYIKELLLQSFSLSVAECFTNVVESILKADSVTQETRSGVDVWVWASVLDQNFENLRKADQIFPRIEDVWKKTFSNVKIKDLVWGKVDFKKHSAEFEALKVLLVLNMAKYSSQLFLLDRPSSFPDYGGKFLHTTGDFILETALFDKKLNKDIYKAFFISSLINFDKIRGRAADVPDWNKESIFLIAMAPLVDLLFISGNLLLLSKFHKNEEIWSPVKEVWDEYIANHDKALETFSIFLKFAEKAFSIPHRGLIRSSWNIKIRDHLSSKVKIESDWRTYGGGRALHEFHKVDHSDPLVRAYLQEDMISLGFEGEDIFVDLYLKKHPKASGIEFSSKDGRVSKAVEAQEAESYED